VICSCTQKPLAAVAQLIAGFQRTSAEVAAAMNLSPAAASFVVSHANA
jgi:hypothetical protein